MDENALLKARFRDLAELCYQKNIYTSTHFLSIADASLFYEIEPELRFVPWELYGICQEAERRILRFGNAETLGYEEEMPICLILAEPLSDKYAEALTHRDYLGALMNLGIERDSIGDIVVRDGKAAIAVLDSVSGLICDSLARVKHTSVSCRVAGRSEYGSVIPTPEFTEINETAASERADLVICKATRLSRGAALPLFAAGLVTLNGRELKNNSTLLKAGDIFTVRGYGKYIYDGSSSVNKKGKLRITIRKYR